MNRSLSKEGRAIGEGDIREGMGVGCLQEYPPAGGILILASEAIPIHKCLQRVHPIALDDIFVKVWDHAGVHVHRIGDSPVQLGL